MSTFPNNFSSEITGPIKLKFVVDLLFIVAPIICGGLCLVLVLLFSTLCPSSLAIILERERAGHLL